MDEIDDYEENFDEETIEYSDDYEETIDIDEENISCISNSIVSNDESYIKYYTNKEKFNEYMTKCELTKILSVRTQQIARGCPVSIIVPDNIYDPYDIAKLELKNKKCPLLIRRYSPDNSYVDVKINDLIIKHSY